MLAACPASASASAPAAQPPAARATRDVAAQARDQARDVLAQRRFQSTSLPSPLRGPRERIGAALYSLWQPLQKAFRAVGDRIPGGATLLWALLAAAALVAAAALATRAGARRVRVAEAQVAQRDGQPNAADLRAQAERAEARGDLDTALRLRFRAGLAELHARELIELRPALGDRDLLRAVPSPTLAALVECFETVAYGGRAARPEDLARAREDWPRVADEGSAR